MEVEAEEGEGDGGLGDFGEHGGDHGARSRGTDGEKTSENENVRVQRLPCCIEHDGGANDTHSDRCDDSGANLVTEGSQSRSDDDADNFVGDSEIAYMGRHLLSVAQQVGENEGLGCGQKDDKRNGQQTRAVEGRGLFEVENTGFHFGSSRSSSCVESVQLRGFGW